MDANPETNSGGATPRRGISLTAKLLLVLVLSAVGIELAARGVDYFQDRDTEFYMPVPADKSFYAPHPFLTYEMVPDRSRDGMYSFHHNSLGFRGKETTVEKPEGVYRILCVGGSTTYGTGCTKDELAYPAQLEAMLAEKAPGQKYEVINCGVSGYGTTENLINIQLRLLELQPDAIIVYHAANDARPIQAKGFKPDYSHLRTSWRETEPNALDLTLLRWCRLYAWATRGRNPDKQTGALFTHIAVEDYESLHVPSSEGVNEEGVEAFIRNLRNIVAVCRANGVEPVLATFASCESKLKPTEEHFLDTVDRQNVRIIELATELDAKLLRLAEGLDDRAEWYDDWMHFNDEGSRVQAMGVYQEAERVGALGL